MESRLGCELGFNLPPQAFCSWTSHCALPPPVHTLMTVQAYGPPLLLDLSLRGSSATEYVLKRSAAEQRPISAVMLATPAAVQASGRGGRGDAVFIRRAETGVVMLTTPAAMQASGGQLLATGRGGRSSWQKGQPLETGRVWWEMECVWRG